MSGAFGPAEFAERFGYRFRDAALLEEALTHPSAAEESGDGRPHNQRLEFLGDAVVGLVASRALMGANPASAEGALSRMRSRVVSEGSLAGAARELGVGSWLRLGRGEEQTGGRAKPAVLSDAFEAIAGALFVDGGYAAAERWVAAALSAAVAAADVATAVDAKTELQERLQGAGRPRPTYSLVGVSGPGHAQVFEVSVAVDGLGEFRGEGASKKRAEQYAAAAALGALTGATRGTKAD
ncbi:MAG: ribonuclease III [Myxococcales bacterium]|nr:ribonuclease III [Myxococcales bacterium]MCB9531424.1 ribonuclease III [Myxococcales bacterium]MCB9534065.1 ribonuclease III [Myxococcales bacterium]